MQRDKNKSHWNELGDKYPRAWEKEAKQWMSQRELNFISKYFEEEDMAALDIGVGNGRILDHHLRCGYASKIYGIDISEEMVRICQNRFRDSEKVISIAVCDISRKEIPFNIKFDFITSIRMLKYNKRPPPPTFPNNSE